MCSKKPIKALGGGISNPTLHALEQLTARKKDSENKTRIKQTRKQKKKKKEIMISSYKLTELFVAALWDCFSHKTAWLNDNQINYLY